MVQLEQFSAFLSTYNFCSSKILDILKKNSVFSRLLLSMFVLFVVLALVYVSLDAVAAFSSVMPLSGLDQSHPTSQRNPPGPAAQRSSEAQGRGTSGESKTKPDRQATSAL